MHKVRVMVASRLKVVHGRIASILNSTENIDLVGREGAGVLEEAMEHHPDLLLYELYSSDDAEYNLLRKIKEKCAWTKIVVFTAYPLRNEKMKLLVDACDGYLQGPLLPGFLLKALELSCYSGHFFFLGSPGDIRNEL